MDRWLSPYHKMTYAAAEVSSRSGCILFASVMAGGSHCFNLLNSCFPEPFVRVPESWGGGAHGNLLLTNISIYTPSREQYRCPVQLGCCRIPIRPEPLRGAIGVTEPGNGVNTLGANPADLCLASPHSHHHHHHYIGGLRPLPPWTSPSKPNTHTVRLHGHTPGDYAAHVTATLAGHPDLAPSAVTERAGSLEHPPQRRREHCLSPHYTFAGVVYNHETHAVQIGAKTHRKLREESTHLPHHGPAGVPFGQAALVKGIRRLFSQWSRGFLTDSSLSSESVRMRTAAIGPLAYDGRSRRCPRHIPQRPPSPLGAPSTSSQTPRQTGCWLGCGVYQPATPPSPGGHPGGRQPTTSTRPNFEPSRAHFPHFNPLYQPARAFFCTLTTPLLWRPFEEALHADGTSALAAPRAPCRDSRLPCGDLTLREYCGLHRLRCEPGLMGLAGTSASGDDTS
eukprot:gene8037-5590_t